MASKAKQTALYACNPNTERGTSTKLDVTKDGKLVYANGRTVIIRDLKDPAIAKTYSGHARNVSVARFSPSGFYCASADISGIVRVWDTVGEDNTLKGEYPAISGKVNDLAWDGESKRIIAAGDGRDRFAKAFMFDTGSSTGEISGHNKVINAVSIRHQRPFRAVTASDDTTIIFHTGVPFKFDKIIRTHSKFVQDVKYAPSGDHFASVSSDYKVFLYDGKTGDVLGEFVGDAHKGSVMACSWSPDSKTLATSSMDGTVKLWDVENKKSIQSWSLGTGVPNQQVGNAWSAGGDIVSLSMSGALNVFDQRVGDKPARFINGPQNPIVASTLAPSGTFLAGTTDGRLYLYDIGDGEGKGSTELVSGQVHTGMVTSIVSAGESVLSVGFDDTLREVSADGKSMIAAQTKLASQPRSAALSPEGTVFVAEGNTVEAFRSNQRVAELKLTYEANAVATTGSVVAIGGEDNKIHLYAWDGKELKAGDVLDGPPSAVYALAFSLDGKLLAAGSANGKIILLNIDEKKIIESRWTSHTARVYSLSFSPSGTHLASGALDAAIYIWSVAKPLQNVPIRHAHPGGVRNVEWLETDTNKGVGKIVSAGADAVVRVWEVKLPGV